MDDYNSSKKLQYLVCLAVSIASMTCGVSIYWTTPMLPKFHNNQTGIIITESEVSWMAALSSLGIMTGSLASSLIADQFGRRPALLGSAGPILIGTVLVVFATKPWMLHLMRFLWGSGVGLLVTISAIYLVEIADKDIRGTLAVGNRFMFNFGSFLVMVVGSFVDYSTLNYMLLVLPITYFTICWWIPETPYYLLKEGKVETAKKELTKLRGLDNEKVIEDQITSMQTDVKNEMRHSGTLKELVTGRQYRKAIFISVGLKLTQIMAGSIPILQYLGRIMQESKMDIEISTALIIFGAIRFVVGILSSFLVEKIGRRPLLIFSYTGSCISFTIVGSYFFYQQAFGTNATDPFRYITFIGIIISNIISTLGFDSLVFVIPAEIFPINVKSIAITSLNIMGGCTSFIMIKCYQNIKDLTGLYGVFWVYASSCAIGAVFSYFVVPETKGKTLREIQIKIQGVYYDDDCLKDKGSDFNENTYVFDSNVQLDDIDEEKCDRFSDINKELTEPNAQLNNAHKNVGDKTALQYHLTDINKGKSIDQLSYIDDDTMTEYNAQLNNAYNNVDKTGLQHNQLNDIDEEK